jgi:oxygen-independent coproporphyrinogen-3 oxidase
VVRKLGGAGTETAGDIPSVSSISARLPARDLEEPPYLSYPEPSELDPRVGRAEYERRLSLAAEAKGEPIELLVHLAFRDGRALYGAPVAGAAAIGAASRSTLDYVGRELDLVAARLGSRRRASRLLVLGSPALYAPRELQSFLARVVSSFPPLPFAELAVEIDPRVATEAHLDVFAGFGFDRASIGDQDLHGSPAEVALTRRALERARRAGLTSLGLGLVCGGSRQTPEAFAAAILTAIDLGLDRITMRPIERDARRRALLAGVATRVLAAAGYQPIGLDTFARGDDLLAAARSAGTLRRTLGGYTATPANDVIGAGAGASSDVAGASFQNALRVSDYESVLIDWHLPTARGLVRDRDDEIRRRGLHDLLCHGRVDTGEMAAFGIALTADFASELERLAPLAREGLVRISGDGVEVLPAGRLAGRELGECFDRRRRGPLARDSTLRFPGPT